MIMTPSELKRNYEEKVRGYFFTKETMRFFGDTMSNFGVRSVYFNGKDYWELYRKEPVGKFKLNSTYWFDKESFKRIRKPERGHDMLKI